MLGLVIIAVGVLISAALIVLFLPGEANDTDKMVLEVGDYLVFENNITNTDGNWWGIWEYNYTIVGADSKNFTWNQTTDIHWPDGRHSYEYYEYTESIENVTNTTFNFQIASLGENATLEGSEKVMTKWGAWRCSKYNVTLSDGYEVIWVRDGVIVKWDYRTYAGWVEISVLKDTNIDQIINP